MDCENCKVLQAEIDELKRQIKVFSANSAAKNMQLKKVEKSRKTFVSVKIEKQKPNTGFLSALKKLKGK